MRSVCRTLPFPTCRYTHRVGLEDGKDGLLGNEVGELDALLVVLLLGVVLVLVLLLELGVLEEDGRASVALDRSTVL